MAEAEQPLEVGVAAAGDDLDAQVAVHAVHAVRGSVDFDDRRVC